MEIKETEREERFSILGNAIRLAAGYLRQACLENGQFVYRIDLGVSYPLVARYNILRHAGAIYALASYNARTPSDSVQQAMILATTFLSRFVGLAFGSPNVLAVWSEPELEQRNGPVVAKLGGTALGLISLLLFEKQLPDSIYTEDLRRLGRFLVRMQNSDGRFASKHFRNAGDERKNDWVSLYYPGQACLALTLLYDHDPLPLWLQTAVKGLVYLAKSRSHRVIVEADHWALLATEAIFSRQCLCRGKDDSKWLLDHTQRVCSSILATLSPNLNGERPGCLTSDGRTCPTATRLEGLLACHHLMQQRDAVLAGRMDEAVEAGIGFLLRSQVREGPFAGAIPRSLITEVAPDAPDMRRANEVRIDYVQHALCAMIRYADYRGI